MDEYLYIIHSKINLNRNRSRLTTTAIKLSDKLEHGIEFSCQMCGDCCRGFNEGEVYIYQSDIFRLAKFFNLKRKSELKEFAKKHFKIIGDSFYWKGSREKFGRLYKFDTIGFKFTGNDEHCEFLDNNNRCTIHEARPFQCRAFPFWKMMVTSSKNLLDYAEKCKGLQTLKGKFYPCEEILNWAEEEYEIEKIYFLEMKKNNFNIFKIYPFLPKSMLKL